MEQPPYRRARQPDVCGNEVSLAISVPGKSESRSAATFLLPLSMTATNLSRSVSVREQQPNRCFRDGNSPLKL